MNERNRIEQLFYCHSCHDLAQVCPFLQHFCAWILLYTFIKPDVPNVFAINLFRKAAISNIELLLKSCVVLKYKNWNGEKGSDVIFAWRWVLVSKELSNANFVIQLMSQFFNSTAIICVLFSDMLKKVFFGISHEIKINNAINDETCCIYQG